MTRLFAISILLPLVALSLPALAESRNMAALEGECRKIVADLSPSLVDVITEVDPDPAEASVRSLSRASRGHSVGSGVVYDHQGHILTTSTVVARAKTIRVLTDDGNYHQATLIGSDPTCNIAVLQAAGTDWQAASFAESSSTDPGGLVLVLGNALGIARAMALGVLSECHPGEETGLPYERMVLSAPVPPGCSGGVVLNWQGEVIGLLTGTVCADRLGQSLGKNPILGLARQQREADLQHLSYAVPMETIRGVAEELIRDGSVAHGYLGAVWAEACEFTAGGYHGEGAVLMAMGDETPAAQSDLQTGDVVLAISGTPVPRPQALLSHLGRRRPGDKVALTILRSGKRSEIQVVLGRAPEKAPDSSLAPWQSLANWLCDQSRRQYLGVTIQGPTEAGQGRDQELLVVEVDPGGPAEAAGFLKGDRIVAAAGEPAVVLQDIVRLVEVTRPGEKVDFRVLRDDKALDLQLTVAHPPHAPAAEAKVTGQPLPATIRIPPPMMVRGTISLEEQIAMLEAELETLRKQLALASGSTSE